MNVAVVNQVADALIAKVESLRPPARSNKPLFDSATFGKQLAREIDRARLTVVRAAAVMQVKPATLYRAIKGRSPDVENYLRIKRWLDGRVYQRPPNLRDFDRRRRPTLS